jgi:hypothetical protein
MGDTLARHNENGRRIVPANILVRSMVRPTRMLAGTIIFKGAVMSVRSPAIMKTTWISCKEDWTFGFSRIFNPPYIESV